MVNRRMTFKPDSIRSKETKSVTNFRFIVCPVPFKCFLSIFKVFRKFTIARNVLCYRLVFHNI